jgi:transmembrane sensor
MATRRADHRRRLDEAAAWFTRLRQESVSEAAIEAFFAWRRSPANNAAYAEVEARWRQADRVRNDPDLVRLTETALRRETLAARLQRALRRPIVPVGVAAAALLAALLLLVGQPEPQVYETDVGAQQIVRLDDGSVLRLNTDSEVAVRYAAAERRLILRRGEAFFEVARDPDRPFVVEAGPARVTALGTKFGVRRADESARVTLVEGRVRVARTRAPEVWTLEPDQQITVNGGASAPHSTDAAAATSWTTGRLRFRETPLAAAVAEVNRYSRGKIVLEADHLRSVQVNGVFDAGDSQAFVSAVSELFGLDAATGPDGAVILRPRRAPAGA